MYTMYSTVNKLMCCKQFAFSTIFNFAFFRDFNTKPFYTILCKNNKLQNLNS